MPPTDATMLFPFPEAPTKEVSPPDFSDRRFFAATLLLVQLRPLPSSVLSSAFRTSREQGTSMQVGGDLSMAAGHDLAMRAADVNAEGRLFATAGHDIDIHAGEASGYARDERLLKYRSGWTKVKEHYIDEGVWTQAQPSTMTANEIAVNAGRNVGIVGSDVGAVQNLAIVAGQDVTITGAENTADDYHHRKTTHETMSPLGQRSTTVYLVSPAMRSHQLISRNKRFSASRLGYPMQEHIDKTIHDLLRGLLAVRAVPARQLVQ